MVDLDMVASNGCPLTRHCRGAARLVVCHEMFMKAAMWIEAKSPDPNATDAPQRFRKYSLTFTIPNLDRWNYRARNG